MMNVEYRLYIMLEDCFVNDENGTEIKFKKGEYHWLRFGDFGNGGWPQIFAGEWYDFCMEEDGTNDCDEMLAKEVKQNKWTEEQNTQYKLFKYNDVVSKIKCEKIPKTDEEYWSVCKEVEQVLIKYDVYVRPSKIAEVVADWMDVD